MITTTVSKSMLQFPGKIRAMKSDIAQRKLQYSLSEYFATVALTKLVRHIDRQDLAWPELQDKYEHWKAMTGLDPRIYQSTGEFKRKLRVKYIAGTREFVVGAFKEDRHTPSGLSMQRIAGILEYGAPEAGIPPRPLFRQVAVEMREYIRMFLRSTKYMTMRKRFDRDYSK